MTSGIAALISVPAGMLVDRGGNRAHLLAFMAGLWSLALAAGGAAPTFPFLLVSRAGLGAMAAIAGPAVASMSGSLIGLGSRGNAYAILLAGELAGAGVGVLAGGLVSSFLTWRAAWFLLAAAGVGLGLAVWRLLPDPGTRITPADAPGAEVRPDENLPEPDPDRILDEDPAHLSIGAAVRYVLSTPSNLVLILASTLGYFFFAGLRTFSFLLLRSRYGLSSLDVVLAVAIIGVSALAGVLAGGRLSDWLMRRGVSSGRMLVSGGGFLTTAVFFTAGLYLDDIRAAVAFFALAMAGLGAANPPLDAARIDVVASGLRGRAEAVRTLSRSAAEAMAPLSLGILATELGAVSIQATNGSRQTGDALSTTFLVTQAPVLAAGLLLVLLGARTYPRDTATAIASDASIRRRFRRGSRRGR